MPAVFLPMINFEGIALEIFPGGHSAVIDILIETTLEQHSQRAKALWEEIAASYDKFAPQYDQAMEDPDAGGRHTGSLSRLMGAHKFTGTVLGLSCSTGVFPRLWHTEAGESDRFTECTFHGVDISTEMIKIAQLNGIPLYEKVHIGPIQEVLPTLKEEFDHILAFGELYILTPTQLSAVLSRMFQLETKSITFTIDQVPDAYNEGARKHGFSHMAGVPTIPRLVKIFLFLKGGNGYL